MEYMGPIRVSTMRAAQRDLAAISNRLALNGQLEVMGEDYI
jgi:flagellar motor switch protein FliG